MFVSALGEWLAGIGVVCLAIAVPNMLFRSKDPPSGPLSDPRFRHAFAAAPYLFWGGLVGLSVGLVIGFATE